MDQSVLGFFLQDVAFLHCALDELQPLHDWICLSVTSDMQTDKNRLFLNMQPNVNWYLGVCVRVCVCIRTFCCCVSSLLSLR